MKNFTKSLWGEISPQRKSTYRKQQLFLTASFAFILLLSAFQSNGQALTNREQFESFTESGSSIEFFTIKPELKITKDEFLKDKLATLQLTQGSEMRFVKTHTNDIGVTSSFYQQYFQNKKVKGAEMVINERNGFVKYVNGHYMKMTPSNSDIFIQEAQGLETALKQIKSTDYLWLNKEAEAAYKRDKHDPNATYLPIGELMYIPDLSKPIETQAFRLVWRYAVHVNPQIESHEIYVDATTGEVVNKIPLTYECSGGTSTTLWNGAQTIFTQLSGASYRTLSDCNSANIHTYNGNGNDNGAGATYYTDADNIWPNTALGNYIAQAHWGSKQTRNYYAAVHAREGYDDAGADLVTYLNPGYTGNAYWTGSATSFGGSSTGASPYVTLDVCGHEHTHGMIDYTSNLTYSYESGALNESFADCIGEAVEEYTLGSADWIHRFEISSGNRSFINPNAKGQPDTYLGTNWYTGAGDAGGVHTNSGVQNYWFYLLSVGGSGTNDNGNAFSVTGITIDKARMITYDCMIALISSSQYADARSVSIQKAKDRYGNCSNEVVQTTNAWRAVGVGAAYIAPLPLSISISASANDICKGSSVVLTASGASTYAWDPGSSVGSSVAFSPSATTTYTVIGTDAEQCTGSKTKTIIVNSIPDVNPIAIDNELCPDQSTSLSAGTNGTINSFITTLAGGNGVSGNAFDIHAYNSITITDFAMNIISGDSAEVWYNPGGYGNANVTSNTGWTKLGATVPITPAGSGALTTIPTTANLTIAAGATYGFIVVCNGSNNYTNGTLVGSIYESNSDLYITEGHGGNGGFGSTFNFVNAPRVFNGSISYRTNFTSYAWTPSATLSSATSSIPLATPTTSTSYTLTATDGNGCTSTGSVKVYMYPKPTITNVTATPSSICIGGTSQMNVTSSTPSSAQTIPTSLVTNNGSAGNMFDVHALNPIIITNVRMNISTGDSAEVWYKPGGYGGANVLSSTGWTKLGATVAITPAGSGALTLIPTTLNLSIPAGATYGIAVLCNGTNNYVNATAIGDIVSSNPDLEIFAGHGGAGFNGLFGFVNSPRAFSGQFDYTVTNSVATYAWSPTFTLTNASIQNPVASPTSTTTYTAIITDQHGCKDTSTKKLYVNPLPEITTSVSPVTICPGDSAQLSVVNNVTEKDSLFTTLTTDNSNAGNAFDIITTKAIILKSLKMQISSGTLAEVWYKPGGYGNANFTGTAGWTKLGATVSITAAGLGALTTIPLTATLTIPSGSTYGLMIVTNGTVNYLNGLTAVGTVYSSNPDLSITVGHGGSGIGSYGFAAFPRVWNGEIVYDAVNALNSYVWTPNTNMNNAFIANPKAAPLTSTVYNLTATDVNGCSATSSIGVNVSPLPQLGTATATPASLCLGSNISLTYTQPLGLGCFGAFQTGFAGTYAPANWTTANVNSNGTVTTASAPSQISITSSNGLVGAGQTSYSITVPCTGIVTFNWEYSTIDSGPQYDYPRYIINSGAPVVFPGMENQAGYPKQQYGTVSISMVAGQTLTLQMNSADNVGGAATVIIKDFKAPYQSFAGQVLNSWFSAAVGGSNLGTGNPQTLTPATAGTFNYYAQISSTVTGCSNTTRTVTNAVVINPIPSVTISATASTICELSNTTLTANGATSYTWQPGGLTGTSITVSPTTTTTYTVTGTGAGGCTSTAIKTIVVNPAPSPGFTTINNTICLGQSSVISCDNNTYTYTWQPGSLSGQTISVSPITSTTYTVTATNIQGCTATALKLVTVNPLPTIGTTVSPSATFCAGGSATITANGGQTYTWQPGGSIGPNLIVTTANTYTVTGTSTQGCTSSATRVITVNPLPTIGSTATATTICEGSSTTITANGGVTYTWEPGSLTGTSVVVSPTTTTTYTITGMNANGCTATSLRTITVNPAPVIAGSASPSIVCPGGTVTLTGTTPGVTWQWNPGALTGSPVVVNPTSQTTYTVTATSAAGCTKTQSFTILMNPVPTVGTTVSPSAVFCAGGSATITANGASTYVWQPGGGTGANLIVTLANTYTVTGTNAQGCTASATRVITVNPIPTVGTTASATTICSGTSTTLTGNGADTYTWNPGGLTGTSVVVSPTTTTTYTVTGVNSTTGCSGTATRLITVNTSPTVGTTVTNATICAGTSTSITGTGANTYTWNPGALSGTTINVSPVATTTYSVTGTNTTTGCTATALRTITVNSAPSVGTTVTNATICVGTSTSITGTGANTYTWNPGALSGTTINVSPATTTTYTVTGTNTLTGCTATSTRLITVNSLPTVGTTVTNATICAGSSTSITGTGAVSYTWNPGALSGTTITVSPAATTTYTVTGTNANGCTATSTRLITVTSCGGSTLNLKCYIQGYYQGGGLMDQVMVNEGISGANSTQTDTITVQLRNTTTPFGVAASIKTILNRNGTAVCNFPISGTYYIAVMHRNAVQTWSANPVALGASPITYDFSNLITKAYGSNMANVGGGVFAFYSGDINVDENIDLSDLGILENDITNFVFGYLATDINGDGNVDILDSPIEEANVNNFVFSIHP